MKIYNHKSKGNRHIMTLYINDQYYNYWYLETEQGVKNVRRGLPVSFILNMRSEVDGINGK